MKSLLNKKRIISIILFLAIILLIIYSGRAQFTSIARNDWDGTFNDENIYTNISEIMEHTEKLKYTSSYDIFEDSNSYYYLLRINADGLPHGVTVITNRISRQYKQSISSSKNSSNDNFLIFKDKNGQDNIIINAGRDVIYRFPLSHGVYAEIIGQFFPSQVSSGFEDGSIKETMLKLRKTLGDENLIKPFDNWTYIFP